MLRPRFTGPFKVVRDINPVTYQLQLPGLFHIFRTCFLQPHGVFDGAGCPSYSVRGRIGVYGMLCVALESLEGRAGAPVQLGRLWPWRTSLNTSKWYLGPYNSQSPTFNKIIHWYNLFRLCVHCPWLGVCCRGLTFHHKTANTNENGVGTGCHESWREPQIGSGIFRISGHGWHIVMLTCLFLESCAHW